MKKLIALLAILIMVTSCTSLGAAWEEMGETGEIPVTTKNRSKALLSIWCEAPILGGISIYVLGIVRAVIPTWPSSCESVVAEDGN